MRATTVICATQRLEPSVDVNGAPALTVNAVIGHAERVLCLASFHESRWVIWDVVVSVDCIHQVVAALRSFIPRRVGTTTIIVGTIGPAECLDLADCRRTVGEAGSVVRDLNTAPWCESAAQRESPFAVVFTHVQPPVEAVAWPTWICRPVSLSQLPSSMTIQLAVSAVCQWSRQEGS